MAGEKADVVMFGPKPIIEEALIKGGMVVHQAWAAPDQDAFIASIAPKVRAIAAVAGHGPVNGAIMGSTLDRSHHFQFDISISDPDTTRPKDKITKIDIVRDGGEVAADPSPAPPAF